MAAKTRKARKKKKTTIRMDQRITKLAKTQPMISSRRTKDLKLPVRTVTIRWRLCEAKLLARSPCKVPLLKKKYMCWSRYKEHIDWSKKKWRNILWTDESKIDFFGSGATDSLSDVLQTLNSSEDGEAWQCKHHVMGMFLILWCGSYFSHTRDHGSVWVHQSTGRSHVAICRRGNAFEMGVSTR